MALYLKRMGREDTFQLPPDKNKIVIGRSLMCDISFPSPHISRQHCQILRVPPNGALIIKNIKNTNYTYINELKLQNSDEFAELQVGCCIGLGVPLEYATVAGMHNNKYVFLKLERSQPTNETRDNSATAENQSGQIEVESRLGDHASDAVQQSHPQETATHVHGVSAATHSVHPQETATHEQGAWVDAPPGHQQQENTHVEGAGATLTGHLQKAPTHMQDTLHADGSHLVPKQDNQVSMVHLQELRLHLHSSKRNLDTGCLPIRMTSPTPQVGSLVPIQDEISQIPITATNTLHVKDRVLECGSGSEGEIKHTRQVENNIKNSHPHEGEPRKLEHPASPILVVDSDDEPKQGLSVSDISSIQEAGDNKIGNVSERENFVTEIEEPHSPIRIDLTQADPDSSPNVELPMNSKKFVQKYFDLTSTNEDIDNDPAQKRNSSEREGKGPLRKRKRGIHSEPSSGTSVPDDGERGSTKKKVRWSLLQSDEDCDSNMDSDSGMELLVDNRRIGKKSSKGATDSNGDDKPLGQETKININSNEVSEHRDSDNDLFVHKRKFNKNAKQCNAQRSKQDSDSDSDNGPKVLKRKLVQNSKRCASSKAAHSSWSEDQLMFTRKTHNPLVVCSSDSDSDFEGVPSRKNGEKDEDEVMFKRKSFKNPHIIYSSDNSDCEGVASRKNGEKDNLASILSMKSCSVFLKKLPSDVGSLLVTRDIKDISTSTYNKKENVSGNEVNHSSEAHGRTSNNKDVSRHRISHSSGTHTDNSDSYKLSQKGRCKPKKKRENSVEEADISCKDEGRVTIKQTTIGQRDRVEKSLDKHLLHAVSEMTNRDENKTKSVPLSTEFRASAATSVSYNFVGSKGNKLVERDKISSKCGSEEGKKSNKEESRASKAEVSTEIKIKTEPSESSEENSNSNKEEPRTSKAEISSEIKIKTKPSESPEGNCNSADDDDEKDGVVFMYSQVGDEIWLSSDEEEEPSPRSDPAPSTSDANLIFVEEDEELPDLMELKSSPVKVDGSDVDDDDQWFPVLSQSFLQSSDEEEERDGDGNKDSKDEADNAVGFELKPESSEVSELVDDNESEDIATDEWWPELSQGFFDEVIEEEEDKEKDKAISSNNNDLDNRVRDEPVRTSSTSDLQSVIEKLQKKAPRTAMLTEPKIPLQRSGRKSQRGSGSSAEVKCSSKTQEATTKVKKTTDEAKKTNKKQNNSRSSGLVNKQSKQNKNLNLRKTLTSQYNLEAYKTTLECRTKEKHHLVNKDKEKSKKSSPDFRLDKRVGTSKANENISIQKKAKVTDAANQDKTRPKVAAKVTHKTRFEKLIDVDLFSVPSKKTEPSKKNSFKIPKSSNVGGASCSSKNSKAADSGLVLNRRKDVEAASSSITAVLVDVKEPDNTSGSAHSGIKNSSTSVASSDPVDKVDKISKSLRKVKLKPSKLKKVHFPEKEEDLISVMFISPRRKGDRTGPPSVRASEMLPEPLKLQRQNIPPYFMELFVHHVCRWNYDWLESYHKAQEKYRAGVLHNAPAQPPVVPSTNYPMLILYSSYNDYRETHSSLFYLELWERIYKDWVKCRTQGGGLQSLIECVNPAFIRISTGTLKFWALKLMVAIPQKQEISVQNFRQGTLISLKIRKDSKRSVIFGFVDHMLVNNRSTTTLPQNQTFAQLGPSFTLGVRVVKETIKTVNPGTVITVTDISYIRPCSRIWEGLHKLPLSPLCQDILSPTPAAFSCERKTEYLVKDLPLNEAQKKAVTEVSSKCMFDPYIPKLSLIHGPPGTGKTSTIVALIGQMAMIGRNFVPVHMPRCKVLICAPSNAAVDELTLRLIHLRNIGQSLRVVRVGFKADNHPVVRNYTLDQYVNKKVEMELSTPRCESARQELQRRKFLVQQVAEDLEKARKEGRQNEVRQLEVRLNEMARAKAELERSFIHEPSIHEKHQLHQKWQQEILLNAEVVTTTLNSCASGSIAEVLARHPYHFTCCIVDEAGQCQETETLQPLLLGIRKLVLVGDHHQLPATVLSQVALSKNLKQSLFERLHHRLVLELQREDVVHTLNVQYRMHPQIVEWPAQHFYQNKLLSEVSTQPISALKPYAIFDLKTSQEQRYNNLEMYNPAEASLVCALLQAMEPHLSMKTVGIITPYQRQRIYLEGKLAQFKGKLNLCINTIDGFQGQERDVIILSFVRANNSASIGFLSHGQRLNVALTRAKEVCYVVASLSSLEGNREWHSLIKNGKQRRVIYTVTTKEENDKNFIKSVIENKVGVT